MKRPTTPFEALLALLKEPGWQTAKPKPAEIRAHVEAHPYVPATAHRSAGALWAVRDAEDADIVILYLRGTEPYYRCAHIIGEESKLEYLERDEVHAWLPLDAKARPLR